MYLNLFYFSWLLEQFGTLLTCQKVIIFGENRADEDDPCPAPAKAKNKKKINNIYRGGFCMCISGRTCFFIFLDFFFSGQSGSQKPLGGSPSGVEWRIAKRKNIYINRFGCIYTIADDVQLIRFLNVRNVSSPEFDFFVPTHSGVYRRNFLKKYFFLMSPICPVNLFTLSPLKKNDLIGFMWIFFFFDGRVSNLCPSKTIRCFETGRPSPTYILELAQSGDV